jgi:hypothetical protein
MRLAIVISLCRNKDMELALHPTSRETKDEDLVSWSIVVDKERIRLADLLVQPIAERALERLASSGQMSRPNARLIVHNLNDRSVVVVQSHIGNSAAQPCDVGRIEASISCALVDCAECAVAAYDQAFAEGARRRNDGAWYAISCCVLWCRWSGSAVCACYAFV